MHKQLPKAPLTFDSVHELLQKHLNNFPDKEAIVAVDPDNDIEIILTYKHFIELIYRTCSYLSELGIKKGDRFAILMHNAPEVLIFELAGSLIGTTTVPLDFKRDTMERKIYKLKDTQAKVLFIKLEGPNDPEEQKQINKACPDITIITWSLLDEFQSLLPNERVDPDKILRDLDSHYVILYTSGTTALPKGVPLTARACLLNAVGIVQWQQFTPNDRFNIVLPLHHINSTEFCLSMLLVGGTIILNSRYSAGRFWQIVNKYNATNTSIVPTILHDLLMRADEFHHQHLDISSLKRICIGSAPVLPLETLNFYNTFKVRVVQGYGQTETALRVAGVPVDTREDIYQQLVKINTIGVELANNEIAILDKNGNVSAENEEGEICISGPVLADGYLNNHKDTALSFKHNWFHSGDLGKWKLIYGKKYFFIIGRIKEIIIKGGVNLSPSAIEDALLQSFPQIDEVSVVGYPDERMGEEIAAVVVPKTGLNPVLERNIKERIIEAAQNGNIKELSRYEAPKKVFILESLPKTSTGKIQRVEVKKMIADLAAKEEIKHYFVRKINPNEPQILKQAIKINNERWRGLPATSKEFVSRAQYGVLWGAFEEHEGLVGSLSCVRLNKSAVNRLKTWDEATAKGTLTNNNPAGDTLLCVAISVESTYPLVISSEEEGYNQFDQLNQLAKSKIQEYIKTGNDHVLNFHKKPKGGLAGAKVWKILQNGRPDDQEALGYNVLMKYPKIDSRTKIIRSNAASPSVLLIEQALLYAQKHGIKNVIAFSRPAGFKNYLITKYLTKS